MLLEHLTAGLEAHVSTAEGERVELWTFWTALPLSLFVRQPFGNWCLLVGIKTVPRLL